MDDDIERNRNTLGLGFKWIDSMMNSGIDLSKAGPN